MNAIGITEVQQPRQRSFRRWFKGEATLFDIAFGIVAPILCFTFDPFVFRAWMAEGPLLPKYQVFAYLFSGIEIIALIIWLSFGKRLEWKRLIGGVFIAGGVVCLATGCLLLPWSFIGLIVLIGAAGFTPFVTALVFFRNGFRAIRSDDTPVSDERRRLSVVFGSLLAIVAPALLSIAIHQAVSLSVTLVVWGEPQEAAAASEALSWLSPLTGDELDRIVNAYDAEHDNLRRELLRKSYREITGEDLETKKQPRFSD
jgi:multidrug transporter EmrE-like cation transporter